MSRRLLLAAGSSEQTEPPVDPPDPEVTPIPDAPIPYAMPTARPYNPPVPCQITTYDGSNQPLHPTVHDFGPGNRWRGYRFWMCHTPYPGMNADPLENPSIMASNNGWDWHTPEGVVNPIFPQPGTSYNSDPDFAWNPVLNRMELIYRPMDGGEHIVHSSSTNGSTWTPIQTIITPAGGIISPALIRLGPTSWRIYARRDDMGIAFWTASSVTGPWSGPTECVVDPGGIPQSPSYNIWHMDAVANPGGGYFFVLASYTASHIYTARSADGVNITVAGTPIISPRNGEWDTSALYRASMTLHENGTHARVWYSGSKDNIVKIGVTEVPLTEWNV